VQQGCGGTAYPTFFREGRMHHHKNAILKNQLKNCIRKHLVNVKAIGLVLMLVDIVEK